MPARKTTEQFILDAIAVHGDAYSYELVRYLDRRTNVTIICPEHGMFSQSPRAHLRGQRCRKCADIGRRGDLERYIERAVKRHGPIYNYDNVKLVVGWNNPVEITCPFHGPFNVAHAKAHVGARAQGCPVCTQAKVSSPKLEIGFQNFIMKSTAIHEGRYDYSSVVWNGYQVPVSILCKFHGIFRQRPYNHVAGHGCCDCANKNGVISKGEHIISSTLTKWGVRYEREWSHPTLINPATGYRLRFDFYIPATGVLIEFDGPQHFIEHSGYFGATDRLEKQRLRDQIKDEWARSNGYKLIRFRSLPTLHRSLHDKKMILTNSSLEDR